MPKSVKIRSEEKTILLRELSALVFTLTREGALCYACRMDSRLFQLKEQLGTGNVLPVYLVCGEEGLLVKEAVRMVEAVALGDSLPEFNHDRMDLADGGVSRVIDAVSTQPMMGGRRVVTVQCSDGLNKEISDGLMAYAQDPNPTGTLILVAGKVEGRLKLVKHLGSERGVLRYDPLKPRDTPAWVVGKAREIGASIDSDAARALVDVIGTDLLSLQTNLEKLVVYVGEARSIRRGDVLECVARTREEAIWDLTDAVGLGDHRKALRTAGNLLQGGQASILVVAMVARHLRQLWTVKSLLQQGCSANDLGRQAKVHPFVAKKLTGQASRFSWAAMPKQFDALYRADLNLKSSRLPDALVVERLLLELCVSAKTVDPSRQVC